MMADDESPRPFRRERNLSNRNFAKRNSARRRFSTESHSSVDSVNMSTGTNNNNNNSDSVDHNIERIGKSRSSIPSTSSMASTNSDTSESVYNMNSLRNMLPPDEAPPPPPAPATPGVDEDPAWLGVKQKVRRFETLQADDSIIFKTGGRYQLISNGSAGRQRVVSNMQPIRVLPMPPTGGAPKRVLVLPIGSATQLNRSRAEDEDDGTSLRPPRSPRPHSATSIAEERSEEDVHENIDATSTALADEYVLPELATELVEQHMPSPAPGFMGAYADDLNPNAIELGIDDFGKVIAVQAAAPATRNSEPAVGVVKPKRRNKKGRHSAGQAPSSLAPVQIQTQTSEPTTQPPEGEELSGATDFPRNYRNGGRPKTEIIGAKNQQLIGKFASFCYPAEKDVVEEPAADEDEAELRNKCDKYVQPILDELIHTEETYVENLLIGIENYGNIFARKDLPAGLRGKKYVLLGNIEQLAEFHRDEFLPMLKRNRRDLKRLFDEFQIFVDDNCFYGYVTFTMNKQRSLKLCDVYKNYFKLIQTNLDDKLGINSFLVQPIQRMARYPLLLQQFISTLFKNRDFVMKPLIESCCRLEKKFRVLLTTTNESEIINDIVECNEFNVFYQGKFRKVSEFNVIDHTLRRTYRSKVFIFDKCIIYTEIKGKSLVLHGRYPYEHIGILARQKSFTLFYERRKQQECDFHGEVTLVETWLELIRDMVHSYVKEEQQKLLEIYSRESDHMHRKSSLSLYRDSNRFSTDSGIGNIWTPPKPETEDAGHRTTWYTQT